MREQHRQVPGDVKFPRLVAQRSVRLILARLSFTLESHDANQTLAGGERGKLLSKTLNQHRRWLKIREEVRS